MLQAVEIVREPEQQSLAALRKQTAAWRTASAESGRALRRAPHGRHVFLPRLAGMMLWA